LFTKPNLYGLILLTALLSSCGIFSSDKKLPSGTRISVLSAGSAVDYAETTIPAAELPAAADITSWNQSGGNSGHSVGNIKTDSNMQKVWQQNFGKGGSKRNLLLSSPVIYRHTVFAQDVNGTVSAFSLTDGTKLWKQKLKPSSKFENENGLNGAGLAVDDNGVYAAAGFGSVFALDFESGNVLWRKDLNAPIRAAPTVCSDKLLVQTLDNRLLALNTQTGEEVWKYNISAEDTVLAGSSAPACSAEKNFAVAGFSNGDIQAFNASIGYPAWTVALIDSAQSNFSTSINSIKASPVIDGDTVYAIGHNDLLAAINYRTGEIIWKQQIGGTNMPWVAGNYLFVLSNNHELLALNKLNGAVLWSSALLNNYDLDERSDIYLSGPIIANNQLLITSSDGTVYAVSPINGKILNQISFKSSIPAAPIAADKTVVFVTDDAELIAYK
jgi:outer membrane protein assembly factor BamB